MQTTVYWDDDSEMIVRAATSAGVCAVRAFPGLYRAARPGYPSRDVSEEVLALGLAAFRRHEITDIFCLLTDGEYFAYYGKDLVKHYRSSGFAVHRFPIQDHRTPRKEMAYRLARELDRTLREGKRVVVHCSAGLGRTGLAVNCLAEWVNVRDGRKIPLGNTQTADQLSFIIGFRRYIYERLRTPE